MAAALWGGGDFAGGMGVGEAGGKPASALRFVMLSHAASLCVLLAVEFALHASLPHGAALWWGLLAGLCAAVSLTAFYIALSRGAMGASAAVSGLLAAAIPAVVSMVMEGRPTALRLAGFAVAAVAIWMIAAAPASSAAQSEHTQGSTMGLAVIAGIGFGVYFTALRMANGLGVLMPMTLARVGSLLTCSVMLGVVAMRGGRVREPGVLWVNRRAAMWAVAAGALDTSGNLLFVAATRVGRLDVAAVLASLYPASTIVLARFVLKERLHTRQVWGMAVAVLAVVMITL